MTTTNNSFVDSFAGIIGGVVGIIVGQPFDTIKARLQVDVLKQYKSSFECATKTISQEGAFSLFKGVTPPCISVAIVNGVCFGTYSVVCNVLQKPDESQLSIAEVTLAGSIGGAVECLIVSPLEYAKLKIQLSHEPLRVTRQPSIGPFRFLQQRWRERGVRGVYRGLAMFAARDVPTFGVYFGSYELCVRAMRARHWHEQSATFLAGGVAGVASWFLCYPMDALKSRFQADERLTYARVWREARRAGVPALFRGCSITLVRAFLVNGVTFGVYEALIARLNRR
mmetsp:Transcript_941/g.1539  ORF Transcript_941/g.1539 Transcript_941/m.1539 type:complete len:283 (-) Transcript_941:61-909(-)